ncbi:MAG: DegT/DnrJ/EryC1/StrS family aminotransferase [Deltaproteobacteria bacterium]|nr:DegT/DnrJ/EryC1/StrS family aminotransferase [Deltaproteobacteria bacterium]
MKVPLLDLKGQYQSIKDEMTPVLNEVIESQLFILGPNVEKLEAEIARYCGAPYAVGVTSGSDALLLALMAMDIAPGDRVITTPYTFFATAGSICRIGAVPLFVDIAPDTFAIDPVKIRALLERLPEAERCRVKAIMPVHLYGQCADMPEIMAIARQYDLKVIEDAAQSLGAAITVDGAERKACSIGDFGCISFFPSKNLGCFGDGGMVTARDEQVARKLKSLRMHGQTYTYHHQYIGMNGRLDALQAAVLLVKLPHLDSWAAGRQKNAAVYAKLFAEAGLLEYITPPVKRAGRSHVYNQFIIRANNRDALKEHLDRNGIGTAVYYPLCLHLQDCFSFLGGKQGDYPEAEKASQETLALPVFPELKREQIEYVVEQIEVFYKK